MKIVSFRAENLKRISAVYIEPSKNIVEITGKNGQGKTSVLDAIWWAIGGTKNVQSKPIRKGAEKAVVSIDFGGLKVTRTFRAQDSGDYTTSLVVENADGFAAKSPQALLDKLVGDLTFDPLAFTRMSAKEQYEALRRFVPGYDFEAAGKATAEDFAERTILNRQIKDLSAQANAIILPAEIPSPVDETALVEKLENAGKHNAEIESRRARREDVSRNIESERALAAQCDERIQELKDEIRRQEEKRDQHTATAESEAKRLAAAPPLPAPIDTSEVRQEIAAARENNAIAARAAERARMNKVIHDLQAKADELTKKMAVREQEKMAAISAAKMPVEGLSFGDGEVLLNGVPLDQGSDAEQLRTSIAIAAARNPDLRIVRVRDGSLLDANSWKVLQDFAEANDLQIWVETVDSGRPGAVVIEDGHVAQSENQIAAE